MRTSAPRKGFTIPIALLVGVVIVILVMSMTATNKINARNQALFNNMNLSYRKAESATVQALGKLILDAKAYDNDKVGFSQSFTDPDGKTKFTVHVYRRDISPTIKNGFYILTSATTTIGGKRYATNTHTYARISNIGEYFAAVNGTLTLAPPPIDLSTAKIYGKDLVLDLASPPPATATVIDFAEYVNSVTPPSGSIPWDQYQFNHGGGPILLQYPLLFPQLVGDDMARYQEKAYYTSSTNPAHRICDFRDWVEIYPPGYNGTPAVDDRYAHLGSTHSYIKKHTDKNSDHIYYCKDDMYIQGRVHGQVLFVAEGDIHVTGNLTVVNLDMNPAASTLPGADEPGNQGASKAHQAVLLTPKNIIIENSPSLVPGSPPNLTSPTWQYLQALFFAPMGTIEPKPYTGPNLGNIYNNLKLELTGSMVLAETPGFSAMCATRRYQYMASLKVNPPPDLPALSQIYYSLEEIVQSGD